MKSITLLVLFIASKITIYSQVNGAVTFDDGQAPLSLLLQKTTPGSSEHMLVQLRTKDGKTIVQPLNYQDTVFKAILLKGHPDEIVLDTYEDTLWAIQGTALKAYALTTGNIIKEIPLPTAAKSISALEIGFGSVPFIADNKTQQLYVWNKGEWEILASGTSLGKPTALSRIYGTLYIGTERDVRKIDLKTKKVSVMAENTGYVKSITIDHLGYLLILTDKNDGLLRLDLEGNQEQVNVPVNNISDIEFNPNTSQLLAIDSKTNIVEELDYFKIIKEEKESSKLRIMKPFERNGYVLSGSEYLIHTIEKAPGSKQILNVLQGFYPEKGIVYQGEIIPETANKKLIECAERSFMAFKKWLQNPPKELQEITANGIPPLFWLMVNDYSSIKEELINPQRPANLWYWKRNPPVIGRVIGYWKWEAVLTKDCQCEIPKEKDIEKFLQEYISKN